MRILLTSNASYDPPRGGSTRSNLTWLRHLAANGHPCRVVCASTTDDRDSESAGIRIQSIRELARRGAMLPAAIEDFGPDYVPDTPDFSRLAPIDFVGGFRGCVGRNEGYSV